MEPRQWTALLFVILAVTSILFYMAILLWGFLTSTRMGVSSISRMLADDMGLTIFYTISVFLYG